MNSDSKNHSDLKIKDDKGQTTTFNATVYYNNDKPCAVVLNESPNNTGAKLNEISDKAMKHTANGISEIHTNMKGGDKLYAFADNGNGTFKQQPFELQVKGSSYDQSAPEKNMSPYSKNTGLDHKPLDSVHKDRMNYTISELQGKNPLSENKMPSIDRGREQQELSQKR